ncbi:MAG: hypothetical protein QF436_00305 [Candidatus Woesearchaeota archaeon]|jgi:hypothetical protein|nr:hypothetical protein [Candidatus Woesearchaeota archaeon]MDP7622547.1 hypothetical protein [Candidatus Woesearchaeota archaeon]HJN56696.1 hypothetical protein [Candidatus Woesearchaeota archaeon]|tara:strand:- start:10928 stop:11209 length:282 start_codon:yes stop_codon:yes gene_type:complete
MTTNLKSDQKELGHVTTNILKEIRRGRTTHSKKVIQDSNEFEQFKSELESNLGVIVDIPQNVRETKSNRTFISYVVKTYSADYHVQNYRNNQI